MASADLAMAAEPVTAPAEPVFATAEPALEMAGAGSGYRKDSGIIEID